VKVFASENVFLRVDWRQKQNFKSAGRFNVVRLRKFVGH